MAVNKEEILYKAICKAATGVDMTPVQSSLDDAMKQESFKILLSAMDEYAKQESEKNVVAFAEWSDEWKRGYHTLKDAISFGGITSLSDLYQYWAENIYKP